MSSEIPADVPKVLYQAYRNRRKLGHCCHLRKDVVGSLVFHCKRPAHEESALCLPHKGITSAEDADTFWQYFKEQIEDDKGDFHDFIGWQFPEHFTFRTERWEAVFRKDADFTDAHFAGDAFFFNARFGGHLYLSRAIVDGALVLEKADIAGRLNISDCVVRGAVRCSFLTTGKSLHAWGARFATEGKGRVSFYGARIGDHAGFKGAEFHTDLDFRDGEIARKLNFQNAQFKGFVYLEGMAPPPSGMFDLPEAMKVEPRKCVELYRMAKQVYTNMGQYDRAGDYHYKERREGWYAERNSRIGKAIKKSKSMVNWLPGKHLCLRKCLARVGYTFGRMSTRFTKILADDILGYFEKPWRIAGRSALLIGACTVLFWAFNLVGTNVDIMAHNIRRDFWQALYFSVVTFTTLGFGDLQPTVGLGWFIAGSEALLGAFLIAGFLVTLARRWGRA